MAKKVKDIITISLLALISFGFLLASLIIPDRDYSMTERRVLAGQPELSFSSLSSGKFMTEFDNYTLDQFPLRDTMRSIKAYTSRHILCNKDNNGLFVYDGYISGTDFELNKERVPKNTDKLAEVYNNYIKNTDCTTYLTIVPDKNYYLAPIAKYPHLDYSALESLVKSELDFAEYIDIFDELGLSCYYKTDQHWKQEEITDVADTLLSAMGADTTSDYEKHCLDIPFYGAYYYQALLKLPSDTIYYLTNETIDNCIITSYNTGTAASSSMYDMEKAYGNDPYEMFLSGSDALLTIENPNSGNDRELIIFRDSFASSLAPLLVCGYSKITLVDLRYIQSHMLREFINFNNQDVLFLYSTLILNN